LLADALNGYEFEKHGEKMAKIESRDKSEKDIKNEDEIRKHKIKSRIKTAVFFGIFLIFLIVNNTGNSDEPGPYPPYDGSVNKLRFQAPALVANTIDGKLLNLSEFKGKVVILDFFSFRSGYVASNILTLNSLKEEFKDSDIEIVGVSFDNFSNIESFNTELNGVRPDYPIVQINNIILKDFHPYDLRRMILLPMVIVIDRNGNIYSRTANVFKKETYASLISDLIKEK